MSVPFSSALYYPSIEIRSDRWLRTAALFWDHLYTIVPQSMSSPYSTALGRELEEQGVLQPLRVSSTMPEVEDLADDVLNYLTDPAAAAMFSDQPSMSASDIRIERLTASLGPLVTLNQLKLPESLRLVFEDTLDGDGWYKVAPEFASYYMTLLARRLSERMGLALTTDSNSADSLARTAFKGRPLSEIRDSVGLATGDYPHYRRMRGNRAEMPGELIPSLLIDFIVKGICLSPSATAKDIVRFKATHREELARFRTEVSKLASNVPSGVPIEALRQAISDQYEHQVRPAMTELTRSLRGHALDGGLTGLLKVSFFSAAPTSAAILAGLPSTVALLAGAGVSLTASAVLIANQRKKQLAESPYSYLLSLEREL